jgi:CheY-like chemotaxis protein
MSNHPTILYAEDEETDVLLLRLALKRSGLAHPLQVVVNGVEAIDYLAGAGAFADRSLYPLPCLVLLDLKMPLKDGFEVLA